MSNKTDETNIDIDKLKSYRVKTIISGVYLKVWDSIKQYLDKNNSSIKLENYLITFTELDAEYVVYFTKPTSHRILGGGNGEAHIRKNDFHILEFNLSR